VKGTLGSSPREGAAALPAESSGPLVWPTDRVRAQARAAAGWFVPFAIVLYLALKNGGYDVTIRSEVGIAIWWVLLVGAVAGVITLSRIRDAGWLLIAALGLLALWTALGIAWSESAERSLIEVARMVTLLGILVLGLGLQGREGLRRTIGGVAGAIGLVAALALISRLQPGWIPAGELQQIPGGGHVTRLNYPLNYWNGLAALMAIGIPLALTLALQARSVLAQALAAASVPVMAATAFFTFSRGGAIEIGIALAVLIALYPRRLTALPTLAIVGIGSGVLIAAGAQRDALENGLLTAAAERQGDEMLAVTLVVVAGIALLQTAIGLGWRYTTLPEIVVPRRVAGWLTGIAAFVLLLIGLAAGVQDRLDREWQEFKEPTVVAAVGTERFESSAGTGRYQVWESAIDASETAPFNGIGPGTFESWWADHGTLPTFLRDAHSLYLEMLAELGIVGFVLIVAFVGGVLAIGVTRARRASEEKRALLAGAVAAAAAFAFAAGVDWVWELTAVSGAFCLLAAAIAGPAVIRVSVQRPGSRRERQRRRIRQRQIERARRPAIIASAIVALIAIALPYVGASHLNASEEAAASDLGTALEEAAKARAVQPSSASASLQEAMLLERTGQLTAAAAAARDATEQDSLNWRTWMVLSRIEARRGNAERSVEAYRRARSLNPRSPLFARLP
jgi:hypothetical protein